jgi:hypothetical protein
MASAKSNVPAAIAYSVNRPDVAVGVALQKYQERFARIRARRLAALIIEMRKNPIQAAQNAVWHQVQQPGLDVFVSEP